MPWKILAAPLALANAQPAAVPPPIQEQAPQAAATLDPTDIIALQAERYRRLTVPVTIMGQGPYRFMIDTGAQATVLSRDLANSLELFDRQTATLIAMASTREVETTRVSDVMLGSRQFSIETAPVLETANIGGADGILGLDSLQHQRVLFDFENSLLAVADADALGGNSGFEIVVRARRRLGQLVIHRARIEGISVAVIIDTGAQGSVGNPHLQRRLRRARGSEDTVMTDVNGVQISGQTRIVSALELGRAAISDFALTFAASPTFAHLGLDDEPAMVLGMNELQMFKRVAIDFSSHQVLFDLPDGTRLTDAFNHHAYPTRVRTD